MRSRSSAADCSDAQGAEGGGEGDGQDGQRDQGLEEGEAALAAGVHGVPWPGRLRMTSPLALPVKRALPPGWRRAARIRGLGAELQARGGAGFGLAVERRPAQRGRRAGCVR
jgi:hypothetical protein